MTASAASPRIPAIEALLGEMVRRGASDLHLTVGAPPRVRVDGVLRDVESCPPLAPSDTLRYASAILAADQRERFAADRDLDLAFGVDGLARFRANCSRQRDGAAVAIRLIPETVPPLGELGLPAIVQRLAERPRGLVLVTGATGSGKSTTLAAMVDHVNRRRRAHIVTIEDPVEFLHRHRRCIVNQREVGADTRSFAAALRHVLRQDPDIVLIGEMRDIETMEAALTLAETGHLVLSTLHTRMASESVGRVVGAFPAERQAQVRSQLASALQGVVTQALLRRASGKGRVAAAEVLVCTAAIRAVIRENKAHQIRSLMQAGRSHGMRTMNDALVQLYMSAQITLEAALRQSDDPSAFLRTVGEPAPDGFGEGLGGYHPPFPGGSGGMGGPRGGLA